MAPELLYMEAKWSSLVSYGLSLDALQDFLPLDRSLDVKTVRSDPLLDWFHCSMKLTVLGQYGKGLVPREAVVGEAICD